MMRKLALVLALTMVSAPATAAPLVCLSKTEQRAVISTGQAVTLATAIHAVRGSVRGSARRSARAKGGREVVRARLCRGSEGLVYVLTVLARDGKVTRTTVDARSGKVVEAR